MPADKFIIPQKVNKTVSKLPLGIQNKIDKAFDRLQQNPIAGIKLKGELSGYFKYRVGEYRIIYAFRPSTKALVIIKIEHRQGVYR